MIDAELRAMPDVADHALEAAHAGTLDWVGMRGIAVPVALGGAGDAPLAARVSAYVDLARAEARGIHMSRLYLHVERALTRAPLTPATLRHALRDFLASHEGLSRRALLRIETALMLKRPALASANAGWKNYPVAIVATADAAHCAIELEVSVLYSSTCPSSAALSRQLIQERFLAEHAGDAVLDRAAVAAWLGRADAICATPHAQRSVADVRVRLAPSFDAFPLVALVDRIEAALATAVQTAVKREDEQAFAKLNAQNLMFCEDAARRVRSALDQDARIADFRVRIAHLESLHAHDAVALATKGVPGGYAAVEPDAAFPQR